MGHMVGGLDLDLRQRSFARYIDNRASSIAAQHLDIATPELLELPQVDPAQLSEGENSLDKRLAAAVATLEGRCDFIVIDCPGSHTRLSQVAHSLADTLITPLNDSFVDFDLLARIDPETSSRKTRLLGGRESFGIDFAFSPIRASRCNGFQGQTATSVVTENGLPSSGSGYA